VGIPIFKLMSQEMITAVIEKRIEMEKISQDDK